jgi:uncharacterized membrane protein
MSVAEAEPPDGVTQSSTEDEREANTPPSPDPEIVDESSEEAREFAHEISRRLMVASSWTGRLPHPSDLEKYDTLVPGAASKLIDEAIQPSVLAEKSIELDRDVSDRVFSLMERDQELRIEESRSDRHFRQHVFSRFLPLFYLPLLIIILVLYAPLSDWAKAVIVFAMLAAYVSPVCISLLRGRMTQREADTIQSLIPKIVAEVTSVLKKQTDSSGSEQTLARSEVERDRLDSSTNSKE